MKLRKLNGYIYKTFFVTLVLQFILKIRFRNKSIIIIICKYICAQLLYLSTTCPQTSSVTTKLRSREADTVFSCSHISDWWNCASRASTSESETGLEQTNKLFIFMPHKMKKEIKRIHIFLINDTLQ